MAERYNRKYKPEYCDKLIEHLTEGLSFTSFAGTIGVHVDTLYEWGRNYPEFLEAKKIGVCKSQLYWEKMGRAMAAGKLQGQPSVWIFNMKNRFRWSDRNETVNENQNIEIIVDQKNKI